MWRRNDKTNLADELILNLHLLAKLTPYFSKCQLIVRVNEPVEPHDVKLVLVILGNIRHDRLNQLQIRLAKSCAKLQ